MLTDARTNRPRSLFRRCLGFFATAWGRAAFVAMAVLVLCNITLIAGRHCGVWDASEFFCPHFILIADHVRHGELLLWTPLIEGGSPTGFDPEVGAFSPFVLGMAALLGPHERAFCAYWLLIWALAGLGVLVLARHYRLPPWMACAASIGYMFSSTFTGEAEYTTYLTVMAMLPWTIWRLEVAIESRRLLPAVEAGAIWGLTALSGYPALIIIGYCYLACWMLGRLLWPVKSRIEPSPAPAPTTNLLRRDWRASVRRLLLGGVFVAVSLPILAPAYIGFLREMRGYTDRGGALSRGEAVNSGALAPRAMSTFASPFLAIAGTWGTTRLWDTDIAMCGIYVCPPLFVLALAAPWMRPRDGFRWWLAGLALLCLAAALGGATPLRGWLYDVLPPMRYFRHAAMFRCYFMFTVVVLASLAGRDLQASIAGGKARHWKLLAAAALGMTVAALVTFRVICLAGHLRPDQWASSRLAAIQILLTWGGIALLAAAAWKNVLSMRSRFGRHLIVLCIVDAALTVVLCQPVMYCNRHNFWSKTETQYVDSIDQTPRGLLRMMSGPVEPRMPLKVCSVQKIAALITFNPLRNFLYEELMRQPVLAAAASGNDRIWFASKASLEPCDKAAAQRLAARSATLGSPCLTISDPKTAAGESASPGGELVPCLETSLERLPPAVRRPVQLRRYDDRCLDFDVTCPEDGWLLVTDRWAPSWRAWVNEVPRPIWIGNMVFRAVPVQRGVNRVRFLYCPQGYTWLLLGSWLTLGLVGVASASSAVRRRKSVSQKSVKTIFLLPHRRRRLGASRLPADGSAK